MLVFICFVFNHSKTNVICFVLVLKQIKTNDISFYYVSKQHNLCWVELGCDKNTETVLFKIKFNFVKIASDFQGVPCPQS